MSEWDPSAFVARLGDRRLSALAPEPEPLQVVYGCRWLRYGCLTLITGREGRGKSSFARQISAATSMGFHALGAKSWHSQECLDPGQVVYVSGDETPGRIAREFERYQEVRFDALSMTDYKFDYAPDRIHAYSVDDVRGPDALTAILETVKPSLLVIDPLMMLVRPERDDYRTVYAAIREWLPYRWETPAKATDERVEDGVCTADDLAYMREAGEIDADGYYMDPPVQHRLPAVLALHHQHRDREMRSDSVSRFIGTVAWGAAVDCIIDMSLPPKEEKTATIRKLEVGKSRFADVPAGTTEWLDFDTKGQDWGNGGPTTYAYRAAGAPAAKLTPDGVESGLRLAVAAWRAKTPNGLKTACSTFLGIPRGSKSARYQSFCRVWEACK